MKRPNIQPDVVKTLSPSNVSSVRTINPLYCPIMKAGRASPATLPSRANKMRKPEDRG